MGQKSTPSGFENIHYHLCKHIYMAQFRGQVILLDTKQDKYTICSQEFSDFLLKIVHNKRLKHSDKIGLDILLKSNVIQCQPIPYPFYIDCKVDTIGVSNIDWRLPVEERKIPWEFSVIRALLSLVKVNFYIKFLGFYKAILLIKRACKKREYIIPSEAELNQLASAVNKACLLYPSRTKCLEWAMSYVLLSLKKGWKCNLEIGVQNYPFKAHAWVECNGKVVMDSQELREGLSIILNEPFRRKQP